MLYKRTPQKQISVLGVCSGLGQRQKGLELAPQVFRDSGLFEVLANIGHIVIEKDDLKPEKNEDSTGWNLIERIRTQASQSLHNGNFLFSVGGDHSIAIGTVQATLLTYPDARLIWVDAHGDINTPQTSVTGNLHGMPLAALLGLFKTPVAGPVINPAKLLLVGVRDLDPAEKLFIDELNISFITADEMLSNTDQAFDKIDIWLKQDAESPIHLSFDIDALDPNVAPATGIRVPFGLTFEVAKNLIRLISSTEKIVSIDLVEMNPLKVETQQELNQTIQNVKSIFFNHL